MNFSEAVRKEGLEAWEWGKGRNEHLHLKEETLYDEMEDHTLPWQVLEIRAKCSFALDISIIISIMIEILQFLLI